MLRKMGIATLALVAIFALVVATRPSHFHIERSARVAAPPPVVFALLEDFRRWQSWSPWEHLDPGMKRVYSGAAQGTGAAYRWAGNDDVGVGNMLITDSRPPNQLTIALEFEEPWQAKNTASFAVAPASGGCQVTWGMDGENNFVFKAVGLFMDMDEMVGNDFETGLSNLRRVAEADAAKVSKRAVDP